MAAVTATTTTKGTKGTKGERTRQALLDGAIRRFAANGYRATSLADVAKANLGVQVGTTSLDAVNQVIKPESQAKVYNNSNDVVTALKDHQIDALVTDLPTALYITAAQVPEATVIGQFPAPGGDKWGALLSKGSALTACVSKAVDELRASGELQKLNSQWMSQSTGAPELR